MEFEGIFCPNCGTKNEEETVEKKIVEQEMEEIENKNKSIAVEKNNFTQATYNLREEEGKKNSPETKVCVIEKPPTEKKVFGIWSLITGILGLCTFGAFLVPEILAIVFGAVSLKNEKSQGLAIAGLVCGIIALLLVMFFMVIGIFA